MSQQQRFVRTIARNGLVGFPAQLSGRDRAKQDLEQIQHVLSAKGVKWKL